MSDDLEETIARVDLRLPFPAGFGKVEKRGDIAVLTLWIDVPDSESRKPRRQCMSREVPAVVIGLRHQIEWLRAFVLDMLVHELDEGFRVDGKMLRDPHMAISETCPDHNNCRISFVSRGDVVSYSCAKDAALRPAPRIWTGNATGSATDLERQR